MAQIYCIENKINGKKYIGETLFNIELRFKEHIKTFQNPRKRDLNRPLYKAFNKYGIDNFFIYLLEECPDEDRWEREKYWIQYYNTFQGQGYNANAGGIGNEKFKHTDQEVIELYQQHKSIQAVASILKCSEETISNRLHKHNIPIVRSFKWEEEQINDIISLYTKEKWTATAIGGKYNVERDVITNILKKNNIEIELHRPKRVLFIGQEQEVIDKYLELKSIRATAKFFSCDITVINKILEEYNISKFTTNAASKKQVIGINLETKEEFKFDSQADAARWIIKQGITDAKLNSVAANISRCQKGERNSCYGMIWR